MVDHDLARQAALHIGDVAVLGRSVDHDVEVLAAAGGHEVIDDSALLVEEQRIFGLHVLSGLEIAGHEPLDVDGLDLTEEQVAQALAVDPAEWRDEIPQIQEWFEKFGDQLPAVLWTELDGLKERLGV
jgi:hypothetical protein